MHALEICASKQFSLKRLREEKTLKLHFFSVASATHDDDGDGDGEYDADARIDDGDDVGNESDDSRNDGSH